jgi:hypothetical protein
MWSGVTDVAFILTLLCDAGDDDSTLDCMPKKHTDSMITITCSSRVHRITHNPIKKRRKENCTVPVAKHTRLTYNGDIVCRLAVAVDHGNRSTACEGGNRGYGRLLPRMHRAHLCHSSWCAPIQIQPPMGMQSHT